MFQDGPFIYELADGQVEYAQAERAEDDRRTFISSRGSFAFEHVFESASDEVTIACRLLCEMNGGLSATDAINIIYDVLTGEDRFRRQSSILCVT